MAPCTSQRVYAQNISQSHWKHNISKSRTRERQNHSEEKRSNYLDARDTRIKRMFSAGIEPATVRVLGGRDNQLHQENLRKFESKQNTELHAILS